MKKVILIILGIVIVGSIFYCKGNEDKKGPKESSQEKVISDKDKQLNITILLDLSDRIVPSEENMNPMERDLNIISEFTEVFKQDWSKKKNNGMQGKMRVLLNPVPNDDNISSILAKLSIDTSKKTDKTPDNYRNLEKNFKDNVRKIYDISLESKKFPGSDLWRFFKYDVKDLTLDKDPKYRNILVVITDGYIYHKDSKMKEGNRYSYLLPQLTKTITKENIEKKDFGLINPCPNKDLGDLEVLMLEISPSNNKEAEYQIIEKVLENWLVEMGVSKYKIYKTDSNLESTKSRIEKFITNK